MGSLPDLYDGAYTVRNPPAYRRGENGPIGLQKNGTEGDAR